MSKPVIIVGAGLSGLAAANTLHQKGVPYLVLEASRVPGGRLRTDHVDGFTLDRGFQVMFTAYPHAKALLDYPSLHLKSFVKGALVLRDRETHSIGLPFFLQTLKSNLFPLADKIKVLSLDRMLKGDENQFGDETAEQMLFAFGFSDAFMDHFARPFFGGIFLDRSLKVSAKQFAWVWRMLSKGETVVPAGGIGDIGVQIANGLPRDTIRFGCRVAEVSKDNVTLVTGEKLDGLAVIVATDTVDKAALLKTGPRPFLQSTCLYFEAAKPPTDRPAIILCADKGTRASHIVPVSVVSPQTAPAGKHLVSVTVLDQPKQSDTDLAESIKVELHDYYPSIGSGGWRFIRAYHIRNAQLRQRPNDPRNLKLYQNESGIWLAGEDQTNSSIDGALQSGKECATALMEAIAL